jgi:hypothetical protein
VQLLREVPAADTVRPLEIQAKRQLLQSGATVGPLQVKAGGRGAPRESQSSTPPA